jgi:peptidoglycan/xylan/chitin deacetylase (PgdA/CDA1 family)
VLTQGYRLRPGTDARAIARFDDGSAALVMHRIGKGRIYVTGLAYYDAVLRAQDDQALDAGRDYDNGFEPSADVPQMIVRDWYLKFVPGAVVTDPTPDGLAGALIITHDVDYIKSVANMPAYARAERAHGFSATFYIQAKTVKDIEDTNFFDAHAKQLVASIYAQGADIASHTVAHSPNWKTFPVGTGKETPENYKPFVKDIAPDHSHGTTLGASLSGEIHVSQERLNACAAGIRVDALRTGYLLINNAQWTVLERYGYRFDSSYGAGEILTSFPYTAMEEQGGSRESHIVEFPIVIADADNWVPMYPHMAAFDQILDKEADIHGVVTTLIHDDVVADKLPTELALVAHARPKMWVGSIDQFGDFWDARAETTVSTQMAAGSETVTVTAPHGSQGLTLDFPGPMTLVSESGTTATLAGGGKSVVLGRIAAGQPVTVTVSPGR